MKCFDKNTIIIYKDNNDFKFKHKIITMKKIDAFQTSSLIEISIYIYKIYKKRRRVNNCLYTYTYKYILNKTFPLFIANFCYTICTIYMVPI